MADLDPITVDITRDKFNDPVEVKLTGLPDGVSVVEEKTTIAKDVGTADITLKAAADAKPVDNQAVTVWASSGTLKQEATFKLSVKKK